MKKDSEFENSINEREIIENVALFKKIDYDKLYVAVGKKGENYLSILKMVTKHLVIKGYKTKEIVKYLFRYCIVMTDLINGCIKDDDDKKLKKKKKIKKEDSYFKDLLNGELTEKDFLTKKYEITNSDDMHEEKLFFLNAFNCSNMNKLNEIYEKKDLKYIIKEYITNKNFLDNCYPYYDSSFDLDYRLLKMQNDYLALEYYYRTRDCLNYKFTISKEEYSSIRGITIDCSEETDEEKKKNKNKEYNQTFTAFSILMYNLIKEVKYPESQAYYTALYILNGAGDPRHFFSNIAFYNQIKESIAYEAITNDISFKMIIDGEKKQYKLTNEGLK